MGKSTKKFTYIEVKECVENLGYKLISDKYINSRSKIIFKDNKGYFYNVVFSSLKIGNIPDKFHKSNPYTIQNIKLWCELNNKSFKLVSKEYNGNDKILKWECLKEECGEEFEAKWRDIFDNCGCSYCRGFKVGLSNCLVTKNPELAKEWHPTKNGDLTPYDITCGNNKEVWWQCSNNPKHEWHTSVNNRSNKNTGCPYCFGNLPSEDYNLLIINPELCKEWDYDKNDKIPEEYCPNAIEYVYWKCKNNNNHKWKASIAIRNSNNTGCPYCSGKLPSEDYNLLVVNPKLCIEWDYDKNKNKPEEYCPYSNDHVWWICKECGYSWFTSIAHRTDKVNGTGCPECNISKGERRIINYLNNINFIKISQEEFEQLIDKDKYNKNYFIPQMKYNGLLGLGNGLLSYDFYISRFNLLIEYQGIQHEKFIPVFHKTMKDFLKQQEHDRRKREYAKNNNINLLEIWYYDFDRIEEILDNYITDN